MLKKVEEFEIKRRGAQLNIMLVILICFEIRSAKEILKVGLVPWCSRSSI